VDNFLAKSYPQSYPQKNASYPQGYPQAVFLRLPSLFFYNRLNYKQFKVFVPKVTVKILKNTAAVPKVTVKIPKVTVKIPKVTVKIPKIKPKTGKISVKIPKVTVCCS